MTRIRHPFYAEYEKLRKICILILRKEGLNVYDHSDEDVFGILFDGAWIWEKYIATLLKGLGFKHYVKNKISVFKEMSTPNFRPDYYNNTESIVLDAKYKRWDINQWGDLHQIISYMYITKSNVGGIVYPVGSDSNEEIDKKVITGEKGVFLRLPFNVPPSDKDFHFNIRKYERKWVSDVKTKIGMDSAN
jgi:5-methylcytosine-specific restriction endonuclease McrBC regulatory subunit McrC